MGDIRKSKTVDMGERGKITVQIEGQVESVGILEPEAVVEKAKPADKAKALLYNAAAEGMMKLVAHLDGQGIDIASPRVKQAIEDTIDDLAEEYV